MQRGIIQAQFLQRLAQRLVIIRTHREQAGKELDDILEIYEPGRYQNCSSVLENLLFVDALHEPYSSRHLAANDRFRELLADDAGSDAILAAYRAEIDRLGLKVKLMPLLSRQVEVDNVLVKGLRLNLEKDAKGRTNWEDLAAQQDKPAAPDPAGPAVDQGPPFALSVQGIEIEDARVSWDDRQSGQQYVVDGARLVTGALAPGVKVPIEAAAGGLPVRGRIDRIDRHRETGAWRVIDYKTGDRVVAPEPSAAPTVPSQRRGYSGLDFARYSCASSSGQPGGRTLCPVCDPATNQGAQAEYQSDALGNEHLKEIFLGM